MVCSAESMLKFFFEKSSYSFCLKLLDLCGCFAALFREKVLVEVYFCGRRSPGLQLNSLTHTNWHSDALLNCLLLIVFGWRVKSSCRWDSWIWRVKSACRM